MEEKQFYRIVLETNETIFESDDGMDVAFQAEILRRNGVYCEVIVSMEEKEYKYHIINKDGDLLYETNDFADATFTRFFLQEKGFDCNITFNIKKGGI